MSAPVTIALIGAGNRGRGIFGQYALDMPHRAKFVAVVEPDEAKRNEMAEQHNIAPDQCFADMDSFFAAERMADAVVIATLESERVEPVRKAIERGYHILAEKPLGCTPQDAIAITDAAQDFDGVFIVCHQMRHGVFYDQIKRMVESGDYGDIVAVQHSENLSYEHMAHSFVRGSFNNDRMTPMILAKSCHDMDFLRYIIDRKPARVSSFGALNHFKPENAPEGAPDRCLDGCPAYDTCPYHVLKLYFNDSTDDAYIRQMGVVRDRHELLEKLHTNRFGRCVYHCDNNVVDHQVVQIEFEGGVVASFAMVGHNYIERRMCKLSMTNGEIEFDWDKGEIRAYTFEPRASAVIERDGFHGTHGGSDRIIMDAFVDAIQTGDPKYIRTPVRVSLDGHLLAHAAEEARVTGTVVTLDEYESRIRATM